jgi:hypothetical protein
VIHTSAFTIHQAHHGCAVREGFTSVKQRRRSTGSNVPGSSPYGIDRTHDAVRRLKSQSSLALRLVKRDLAKAEGEGNIRTEELRKSDRRRTFQSLRAPVDRTV